MSNFGYRAGILTCDQVPLAEIAAQVGTPVYVYSLAEIAARYRAYADAFPGALIAYAYKANANPALCRFLVQLGAGADVVSGGELFIARRAGVPDERIVFNGTGKTRREIAEALAGGIRAINLDAAEELETVAGLAGELGTRAPVALRVNPAVAADTHRHVATGRRGSHFGVPLDQALTVGQRAAGTPGIALVGVHSHIGSQITAVAPFVAAAERLADLVGALRRAGAPVQHMNLGGGLGIGYQNETLPTPAGLAAALRPIVQPLAVDLILEPGRWLVGPAGALVTTVIHVKRGGPDEPDRVVVDAGMNALLRPALYDAWHAIWPLRQEPAAGRFDVVGPVCESADVLGRDRALPPLAPGDRLAILDAGAYGYAMASTYNGRPRPAEVAVRGDRWWVIRQPETYADLVAGAVIPPEMLADPPTVAMS